MPSGDKAELDRRVAFALYNRSESEVAAITAEFIRQLSQMLAEYGEVTVDRLGRFRVESRPTNRGNLNISFKRKRNGKDVTSVVVTPRHLLVHFSKSKPLKALLDREHQESSMEKYGVDETTGHDPEQLEKLAAKGCPECGSALTKHGSVLICPTHGSAPFEVSHDQKVRGNNGT